MMRSIALGVFFSYWMREETDKKKEVYFQKVEGACEQMLENRRKIDALFKMEPLVLDVLINGTRENIEVVIDLYRTFARQLVLNREVVGVCPHCNQGILRFEQRPISLGAAICSNCKGCYFKFDDVLQYVV